MPIVDLEQLSEFLDVLHKVPGRILIRVRSAMKGKFECIILIRMILTEQTFQRLFDRIERSATGALEMEVWHYLHLNKNLVFLRVEISTI
jgi:hypothetical protein